MSELMIATPVYGNPAVASVALGWHRAVMQFARAPGVTIADPWFFMNKDIVRARARAVSVALEGGFDHLLFWDADVAGEPGELAAALRGMLASGFDLVGCAPPKKTPVNWTSVAAKAAFGATSAQALRTAGADYSSVLEVARGEPVNGCLPAKYLPMGFTLISRRCLEAMTKHYDPQLGYKDKYEGGWHRAVAFFSPVIVEGPRLLSEDYSFCQRWEWMGQKSYLYVGEGATACKHVGAAMFG